MTPMRALCTSSSTAKSRDSRSEGMSFLERSRTSRVQAGMSSSARKRSYETMLRIIRTMAPVAMASTLLTVAGCSTPQLPNSQTASEQFSKLGPAQKRVASTFYDLGQGDAVKRLYWAQRQAQESAGTVEVQP